VPRTFAPGSEWLFAKIYTGTAGADDALRNVVKPVLDGARARGYIERWFFIRYADPNWHVRLRIRGAPDFLTSVVLPLLHETAMPHFRTGRIAKMALDTYEREIERYGGPEGTDLAEALFEADSEAVLAVVAHLGEAEAEDTRWRLAFYGSHVLLTDLELDLPARTRLVQRARARYAREQHIEAVDPTKSRSKDTVAFEKQLGAKFRAERARLESLLEGGPEVDPLLAPGLAAFRERSRKLGPIVQTLREHERAGLLTASWPELAASFVHMCASRIFRSELRPHELVVYDFLSRLYESEAARRAR
jgi:thiopeptide-type bacteriocin biosynthesis protein